MAVSVNWVTGEITIPRADMPVIQVSPEIRQLDTAQLWLDLKDLEATADGMPWPDTQVNFPSYLISGITYAQAFQIIPPYFITFEDGQYGVSLVGTNNNIIDVATSNQVRILGNNSAGLIEGSLGPADIQLFFDFVVENGESFAEITRLLRANAAGKIVQDGAGNYQIRDAADSKDRIDGSLAANNGRDINSTDGS